MPKGYLDHGELGKQKYGSRAFQWCRQGARIRQMAMLRFGKQALLATIAAAFTLGPVAAAEHSAWDGDARAAARLIAGTTARDSAALRGGIEIRLAPGWKTYWRYPGDSGVPPRFD